jgi:hypothetical protein
MSSFMAREVQRSNYDGKVIQKHERWNRYIPFEFIRSVKPPSRLWQTEFSPGHNLYKRVTSAFRSAPMESKLTSWVFRQYLPHAQ